MTAPGKTLAEMARDFGANPTRRPPLVHLDMTLRQVLGADHSWHEGTYTTLLHAVTDLAQDACDFADEINRTGDPERDAAFELQSRERILAVISLAQQALMMFDAEQAQAKAVQPSSPLAKLTLSSPISDFWEPGTGPADDDDITWGDAAFVAHEASFLAQEKQDPTERLRWLRVARAMSGHAIAMLDAEQAEKKGAA